MRNLLSHSLPHSIWNLLLSNLQAVSDPLGTKQVKMAERPRIKHFLFFCSFQAIFGQVINNNQQTQMPITLDKRSFILHTSFSCIQKCI